MWGSTPYHRGSAPQHLFCSERGALPLLLRCVPTGAPAIITWQAQLTKCPA